MATATQERTNSDFSNLRRLRNDFGTLFVASQTRSSQT